MTKFFSRATFAAGALLAMCLGAQAQSVSPELKFRAIQVDTSHYATGGLGGFVGGYSDSVRNSVLAHARQTFADRMTRDPSAPVLVIRVDSVMLTGQSGHFTSRHGGLIEDNARDFMQGSGNVVKNGRVISSVPIMAAKDAIDLGGNEPQRLDDLSGFYVGWVRRELGL